MRSTNVLNSTPSTANQKNNMENDRNGREPGMAMENENMFIFKCTRLLNTLVVAGAGVYLCVCTPFDNTCKLDG